MKERTRARLLEDELALLMARYQAGEMTVVEQVYGHFCDPLRRYFHSTTGDSGRTQDLVQETFLQLHRSRRTYRPGTPVTPWVFGIARHVHLMERRTLVRRGRLELRRNVEHPEPLVESSAGRIVAGQTIERALEQLPPLSRQVLRLRYLAGMVSILLTDCFEEPLE